MRRLRLTYTAPASLQVGAAISPMSPSGGSDIGEYSTADLPSGLSIDDTSGEISGTPDTANASTASATVTVSDAAGNTDTVSITFPAVDKGDQTLSGFQYGPASVTFGSGTVPGVTAPTGVLTTLSYSATPAEVCTVDSANGALTLVGAGSLRDHRHGGCHGELQRSSRGLHGQCAGRRRAGAESPDNRG